MTLVLVTVRLLPSWVRLALCELILPSASVTRVVSAESAVALALPATTPDRLSSAACREVSQLACDDRLPACWVTIVWSAWSASAVARPGIAACNAVTASATISI